MGYYLFLALDTAAGHKQNPIHAGRRSRVLANSHIIAATDSHFIYELAKNHTQKNLHTQVSVSDSLRRR